MNVDSTMITKNGNLIVSNTIKTAFEEVEVFTAKEIKLDGAIFKPEYTSEGLKVPFIYNQDNKSKVCYILIPKDQIIACMKDCFMEVMRSI